MNSEEPIGNKIVLRPRFKLELNTRNESVLAAFEIKQNETNDFEIQRVDDHVFIKIPKVQQHFWSPQLDLEIIDNENNTCTLHGLFGPKPAVWTLFMFLHFIVATLFLSAGVWAYSNYSLDKSYSLQLAGMVLLLISWFALYFAGRLGKQAGEKEMLALYQCMQQIVAS